jgi:hypothetical protein
VLAVVYRYGLLGQAVDRERAYGHATTYLRLLDRNYPDIQMNAARLREAVLALHHDRLLRRYLFSDEQLELFLDLAYEIVTGPDLAPLRRGWRD